MDTPLFEQLHNEGLVSAEELVRVRAHEHGRNISVHWDLRTLLYLSILLLTGGIGVLLYKNADTIGHATLVILAGLLAATCLAYCFRLARPYNNAMVESPNVWFDYILLLGCLLLLAFVGYLQFQYHVFGMQWGLATFIPMLFLFAFAYYFDHKGVLGLAITNLGAWLGIAVAPMQLIRSSQMGNGDLIINGIILGLLLHLFMWLTGNFNVKAHFATVYRNFGVHVLFIALIAAMAHFDNVYFLWFLIIAGVAALYIHNAIAQSSFYYLVVTALYGYVGAGYLVVRFVITMGVDSIFLVYLVFIYFILSAVGLVRVLMRYNKLLKKNDSVQ